jgi:glutamate racemase
MIGVLDSGIGGLSVLREIVSRLPHQDILYIADQGHLPYGPRPLSEIQQFSEGISRYFLEQGAKLIVLACNTASAAALAYLRETFPDVPFIGLEPAVRPAARDTRNHTIGVIATAATFQGELYASLIDRFATDMTVIARACPELVMLAERGNPWTDEDYALVADVLEDIRDSRADQLVLGCTHFAFLTPLIQAALGEEVAIIDPAPAVARQVERVLQERGLLKASGNPTISYFTTGDLPKFRWQIHSLLGLAPEQAGRLRWLDGRLIPS